jgi:cystathionine beta-lyase family protein involved in aluminum resistance
VSIDKESFKEMTIKEIKEQGLNIVLSKDNGYSHFWTEIVPFNKKHIFYTVDLVTGKRFKNLYCTRKKSFGGVKGSSVVSFS